MQFSARSRVGLTMPAILLIILVVAVWIGGGSSRSDVMGQVVVRGVAWSCLVALVLFGPDLRVTRGRTVLAFIIVCGTLVALQLVPLPPAWWAALPGRAAYAEADAIVGGAQPWRPLAIVPSLTLNALGSLIVPLTTAFLIANPRHVDDRLLVRIMVCVVIATMGVGLLQFAGIALYVPIINGGDEISGNFANRNHFALMMACGLLLLPVWALGKRQASQWRVLIMLALIPLLALAILASGSRTGMFLGVVALGTAAMLVRQPLRQAFRRYPPWVLPATIAGIFGALALLVGISFVADRALSISRALTLDPSQDMRSGALPTIWAMLREYFPFGAGVGGFDTIFRQHEPYRLLKLTYFNRAHDDFLEIVLDAGLPGLALLVAAVCWWLVMSIRAWSTRAGTESDLARVGSILLLLVMFSSIVDYPARTPLMMVVIVFAAVWLSSAGRAGKATLPQTAQHL
jgi:O-antigen ligase